MILEKRSWRPPRFWTGSCTCGARNICTRFDPLQLAVFRKPRDGYHLFVPYLFGGDGGLRRSKEDSRSSSLRFPCSILRRGVQCPNPGGIVPKDFTVMRRHFSGKVRLIWRRTSIWAIGLE